MSIITLLDELWRFIKDYFIILLVGACVFAALLGGFRYYRGSHGFSEQTASYEHLAHVYAQEPASFKMIFLNEEGDMFTNSFLLDEYFEVDEIRQIVEEETGVAIGDVLEAEQALELYKTPHFRGGLAGIQEKSSGVLTFRFLVGETAEENLRVAEAYEALLLNKAFPFMEKLDMYEVEAPSVGEIVHPDDLPALASLDVLNPYAQVSKKSLIIYSFLGFVLGTILTAGFLLLKRLLSSKIVYAFEYGWDFSDQHYLVDSKADLEEILQQIEGPLLEEGKVLPEIKDQNISIIIRSNETDKKWYRSTYQLAHLLAKQVAIIHVRAE